MLCYEASKTLCCKGIPKIEGMEQRVLLIVCIMQATSISLHLLHRLCVDSMVMMLVACSCDSMTDLSVLTFLYTNTKLPSYKTTFCIVEARIHEAGALLCEGAIIASPCAAEHEQ